MKYKKFKDIKPNDKIYFIQDYEKLNGQKVTSNIEETFAALLVKPEIISEGIDICEVNVKDIEYPTIRRHAINYMKMSGDKPNGVGTSYAEEPDDKYITIIFESLYSSLCKTSFDTPIDNTSYSPIKGGIYFTTKQEAIKYFEELSDFYINKYIEESKNYKQKANSLKEHKKHIFATY